MRPPDRWLFGNVIYRAAVVARGEGSVFDRLHALRTIEQAPAPDLEEEAATRLRSILTHAREHSLWYRKRLPDQIPTAPEELSGFLASVPILEKRDVRLHRELLLAHPRPRRVTVKTTGGSTGEAVTVVKDRAAIAQEMAGSWLGYGWFGIQIGDRAVRFWGNPRSDRRRLRFIAADLAMHRIRFSAFGFGPEELEDYWQRTRRFSPDYLYGYVSMLVDFARHVATRGHDGRKVGLKAVVTTSEVLKPADETLLRDVFGCPVQNEYGCGEVGPIAYSCPAGKLHVLSSNVHLEVVDSDGQPVPPGKSGELLVTDLGNRAMPLIRYRVGDRGVMAEAPCPCGRPFPVLAGIWGRAYDFVDGPNGRRYHGEFFMYLFEELRERGLPFDTFQVIQSAPARLEVLLVTPSVDPELAAIVTSRFREAMGAVEVDVRAVDTIPRIASGKTRVVVNHLATDR